MRFFIVLFFLSFISAVGAVEIKNENISTEKNANTVFEQIQINESEFDNITDFLKPRYSDFNWTGFDDLDSGTKRIVLRNLLAQEAFEEIKQKYIKDIYERSSEEIIYQEDNFNKYYTNKSDAEYWRDSATDNIFKEAKERGILYDTNGFMYLKQQDVSIIDQLINKQNDIYSGDMFCEKYCVRFDKKTEDSLQEYFANIMENINDYEQKIMQLLEEYNEKISQYEAETELRDDAFSDEKKDINSYSYKKDLRKQLESKGISFKERYKKAKQIIEQRNVFLDKKRDAIIGARQELAQQMRNKYQEELQLLEEDIRNKTEKYDAMALDMSLNLRRLLFEPYSSDCEMVSVGCWNVKQLPQDYERFRLRISDTGRKTHSIHYSYDDLLNNEHIDSSAYSSCDCNDKDLSSLVACSCSISFYDTVSDFSAFRNWQNQDRMDIRHGKMQDHDSSGRVLHEWQGDKIPMGGLSGQTIFMYGEAK